jgi:hypothetical protein
LSSSTGTGSSGTCTRHLSTEDQLHERLWVLVNSLMQVPLEPVPVLLDKAVLLDRDSNLLALSVSPSLRWKPSLD